MIRRIGLIVLWAAALVGLALAGTFGFAQTDVGKRLIADDVGRALSDAEMTVRLEGLTGLVPFDLRLERLRVADAEGVWLELDDARLSWSPAALLRVRLEINDLGARRLALLRLPSYEEHDPLPELPRSIPPVAVRHLEVEQIELGQAVLGKRAVFALLGELTTAEAGRAVSLTLDLERTDEDTAQASIATRLDLARRHLDLDVDASETGGLLAMVAGRPDAGSFTFELSGNGPLDGWRGTLRAEGERVARAEAEIALAINDAIRARVDSVFEPAPGLLPRPGPELLGDQVTVAFAAVYTEPEQLAVENLRIAGTAVEVTGSGRVDFAAEQLSAQANVVLRDLAALAIVAGTPLAGSLDLRADIEGPLQQPKGRLVLEARGIEAAGLGAERVQTTLDFAALEALTAPGARMQLAAQGQAQGLALPPDVRLPPQNLDWRAAATAPVDGAGAVTVEQLNLRVDHLDLTAQGAVDLTTLGGEARLTLALDALLPFTEPYGQPIDGAADLRATVGIGAGAEVISVDLYGDFHELSGLPPGAAELLGPSPTVEANAIVVPNDSVEITHLSVAGAAAMLDAALEMALPGQTLDGTLKLDLPRLAVLARPIGTEIDGELTAQAHLSGSIDAPALKLDVQSPGLSVAGEHINSLAFTGSAKGAADDLDGALRLAATARGIEAEVASGFELRAPTLRLTNLTLSAPRTKAEGELSIDLERSLVEGELSGRIQELAVYAALLPVALRGQIDFEARGDTKDGVQTAALAVQGRELRSDFARLRQLGLQATLAEPFGARRVTVDLTLDDLRQNEVELTQGKLSAIGTPEELEVTASVTGEAQFVPFTLDGRAGVAVGDQVVVRVDALSGRVADEPLSLARSALLTVADRRFAVENLDLRLGGARLAGQFALGPSEVAAQATLDPLPLAMLGRFGGAPDLTGDLVARLTLQGPPDNPSGTLEVRATEVAVASPMLADVPAAELTLSGALQARRLRLDLRGEGMTDQPIRLNAELPLVVDLAAGAFDVPSEGRLAGSLDAEVSLTRLADILALDDQRLEGPLSAHLTVSGTVARPGVDGTVRIDNALYENGTTGTVLRDLTLRARATRQTFTIEQLTANDGGQGRLAADGTMAIDPSADYPVHLRVQLERAQLVARDDVTATMSGELAVEGRVAAPQLQGQITVNRAEILIPESLGPSVAVLPVEEVGGRVESRLSDANDAQSEFDLGLDVTVDLPGQVFVRGRGLDSEWEGRLHAEGTVAKPRVTGNLRVRRGGFELLGHRFDLRGGTIQFTGQTPPNPMLDLQAVTRAADITAVVRVEGEAADPQFRLDSEPSMPEDEIVSRLLFRRAAGRLGPGDAIRLAAAVNTLRGGGLGVMGQARQALGLGTLGVSGEGLEGGRVRAGRYLNDNVFVEVGRGAAAGSGDVRVEVEILPNLSLDAGTDARAQSGVGLRWRFDY